MEVENEVVMLRKQLATRTSMRVVSPEGSYDSRRPALQVRSRAFVVTASRMTRVARAG